MANNAWHYKEHQCSVCGLPLRTAEQGWLLEAKEQTLSFQAPEFATDEAMAELEKNERWLDDAVLLCDPNDEMGQRMPSFKYEKLSNYGFQHPQIKYPSSTPPRIITKPSAIEEHEALHLGGPFFHLVEPGGRKTEVNIHHWDFPTFDGRAYIPIHSNCLTIAKKVLASSRPKSLKDMRSLFLALRWRHAIAQISGGARETSNYMLQPACWYLPDWIFWEANNYNENLNRNPLWPGPTMDAEFNMLYTFLSDPMQIPDLTGTLLSNLEGCESEVADPEARKLQSRLVNLPEDVFRIVLLHLRSCEELPRTPTYTLPQSFWKNELILGTGGILPYLWDIEPEKVLAKAAQSCPGESYGEWNWELLVRKLSRRVDGGARPELLEFLDHYDQHINTQGVYDDDRWGYSGYHNDLKHVPKGLHNRRRIWQLLEEMFVGDQLPQAGKVREGISPLRPVEECVELPWTKSGGLREAPLWLPALRIDDAFVRIIGGCVYAIPQRAQPLQYWQTEEYKRLYGEELEKSTRSGSVGEIFEVLRKLEYLV
ncbi:hypothetical protein HD806DRAFT_516051 [Xylariaceae sp. AK1471]|nr:hypothetical protein HD806DRAFT_516051 [Xylariaceae sp. AK1471]